MPELILLDWNIPNSNVIEFLRSLRRERGGADPVVVFCTTENDVAPHQRSHAGRRQRLRAQALRPPAIAEKLTQVGLI